jgi:hypothetical protein
MRRVGHWLKMIVDALLGGTCTLGFLYLFLA